MAEENRERQSTTADENRAPKETRAETERLLREQELVNEREDQPQQFGGMATPPVETADRNRPEKTPAVKEGEARRRPTDIQSEGA